MCALAGEGGGVEVAGGTRASRARAEVSAMELMDPGDMLHQIFIVRTLGLGGRGGEGWCEICTTAMPVEYANLAAKVLELTSRRFFWLCIHGAHGRQCYCKHLYDWGV